MPDPTNPGPVFQQTNWTVQGNVYNVAGDLVLSKESTKVDFQQVLDDLKQEILKLQSLDTSRKEELARDVESAQRESQRETPEKNVVVSRLNTVKATLEAVKDTVLGASDVAKTVAQVA